MSSVRVLLVDDSVIVRRMVARTLDAEATLDVVGTAHNGEVALGNVEDLAPDVVVLDVEMPVMDGLETLRILQERHPEIAVIMFSSLTERGAETTLDALELGASDYVAKPDGSKGMTGTQARIRGELVPKLRAVGLASEGGRPGASASAHGHENERRHRTTPTTGIDVVAIGASTGGPNALGSLIPALPADLPVPVVVVQHMPPVFTASLAERLDGKSALSVQEGSEGDVIAPGGVWIAPGDAHMELAREGTSVRLHLHQDPPENSCRPAVDVLFRSVPAVYGRRALGLVLTGMGEDGLRGVRRIIEAGGQSIVQDEDSSVVWGMPGAVARANMAEAILPLDEIAKEVEKRAAKRRTRKTVSQP